MATIWDGNEMLENISEADAKKMVKEDKGQWLEFHDGSAFKHRSEFTGYKNKSMATKVDDTAPGEKEAPKKKKTITKKA